MDGTSLSRERDAAKESEEFSWAEFASFQVRRTMIPSRKRVTGRSIDEETSQPSQFVPHIKLNAAIHASSESQYIDADNIRRETFRQRNVYGHSSNSSIARLLYSESTESSLAVEPVAEVIETGYCL